MSDNDTALKLNPTVDFLAGTISGVAGLVVGYPFDTVKVRFQTPEFRHRYRSTFHALATIVREERFVGLFKGIMSPIATVALMNGLVFASYRLFMKMQLEDASSVPTLTQILLAGSGSGIVSSIITTPTELVKIRQQALSTTTSTPTVALNIFRESGLRGLYRGITSTALRDIGYGAYFVAYEATCRYFAMPRTVVRNTDHSSIYAEVEETSRLSWPALLVAGGVAGIAGWVFTFPFDVVKTRMQSPPQPLVNPASAPFAAGAAAPLLPRPAIDPQRTTWSTVVHCYRTEGMGIFFRGLAPTLIRAVPVNMATFATFEAVVHALS
ncbi:mitochondrial carrier domain-containing protein [Schizophyllum amplum]|uniref:Mitochondrial carrier domain-containing protein n=1 Tax=Schizophyllum amplum TaxID=97359 RepID=A0A550CUC7_9AGAR|nr:mitochondrial carrier domain-containing protein [Auriculariopsis ampla]